MAKPDPRNVKFKSIEADMRTKIPKNSIVAIRLDGKSFSKFTKQYDMPFDTRFMNTMDKTAIFIMKNVLSGSMFAYVQSDEITIFFTDLWREYSQFPFDGKVEKLLSISASAATGGFMKYDKNIEGIPMFDARLLILDNMDEVQEYMDWRRLDARKNSITMAAGCVLTQKELMGKTTAERKEILEGTEFEKLPDEFYNGRIIFRETQRKEVTFFDKKEKQEKTIFADKKNWVVKPALRDTTENIVNSFRKIVK